MKYDFEEIAEHFDFSGRFLEASPYGSGHINDTFAATFEKADGRTHRYLLQKINHMVFKEPEKLMMNIEAVTKHLRAGIIAAGGDPERETLNIIPAADGKSFYKTEKGDYWRGYVFIENARTYDVVENPDHLYNGGKAFGRFQKLLCDFPAEKLNETIPDFHNTKKRFNAFVKAVEQDEANRAATVKEEIEFILRRKEDVPVLVDLLEAGKLPLRVTHNDTKFNNVMIDDKTGEAVCVIDLDTAMPGLSLYDFGDAVRSGVSPAGEDERDLTKVGVELRLFERFTQGFMDSARAFLTPLEVEFLPFAAKIMTLECGMRFLTDYLNGDTYFKIRREGHNLDRARTQLKLVSDMEGENDKMAGIVQKYR